MCSTFVCIHVGSVVVYIVTCVYISPVTSNKNPLLHPPVLSIVYIYRVTYEWGPNLDMCIRDTARQELHLHF